MQRDELNRRDFTRLTTAALGGLVAGSVIGCGGDKPAEPAKKDEKKPDGEAVASPMLEGKNVCRGLNLCKGKGASKDNACAGQGTCASAKAHTCHAANECKGEGGCGKTAGLNECKGKGECGVPLAPETWKTARAKFEELMKAAGKEVGAAPAAPKEG